MAFSDLWQLSSDNEDLEGFEELQFDHVVDRPQQWSKGIDLQRAKRNKRSLVVGLVGFILIMGWLMVAISRN